MACLDKESTFLTVSQQFLPHSGSIWAIHEGTLDEKDSVYLAREFPGFRCGLVENMKNAECVQGGMMRVVMGESSRIKTLSMRTDFKPDTPVAAALQSKAVISIG
jgi:hypothetical protein